jgi:hypothetical protein
MTSSAACSSCAKTRTVQVGNVAALLRRRVQIVRMRSSHNYPSYSIVLVNIAWPFGPGHRISPAVNLVRTPSPGFTATRMVQPVGAMQKNLNRVGGHLLSTPDSRPCVHQPVLRTSMRASHAGLSVQIHRRCLANASPRNGGVA